MGLTYFTDAQDETLVLDNLMSAISSVLVRHGLQTVYGFNGGDLTVDQ
jgi:hypothetical protein